jgi:hypothetical protein
MNRSQIWVNPDFKRKLKRMAADADMNMLDLTKALAKRNDIDETPKKEFKKIEFRF